MDAINQRFPKRPRPGVIVVGLALLATLAQAQITATSKISQVSSTKHNLSASGTGSVKASSESQVCVFCHTPHGATTSGITAPLWNRTLSTAATYTTYTSTSMEADAGELAIAPGGSSKLCLSCHDGTMAIDKVNVLNGAAGVVTVPMTTATPVTMPGGSGATTGFTRNLGTDLSNDHPISFTYTSTLAGYDGELRVPDGTVVGNRVAGTTPPLMPLENNQMQCATCHDPHVRDSGEGNTHAKFLRLNRFQILQPAGGSFDTTNDIVCLACHDKGGLSWAYSAHANEGVADETYTSTAATQREFPVAGTEGPEVWQASCLNCHDSHTVQGARRLLREGTDSTATPKVGGDPALEETCYQCHIASGSASSALNASASVPDIQTDFTTAGTHMPITTSEQPDGLTEVHEIGGVFADYDSSAGINDCDNAATAPVGQCGKDLLESRAKLGVANLDNRHVECSDCHNPHRVIKAQNGLPGLLSSGNTQDTEGTHPHTDDNTSTTVHTNIISGVLRGSWGVEPSYSSASFQGTSDTIGAALGITYTVKRGDPGASISSLVTETYVTREYQICLKCHSDYGYPDNNLAENPPASDVLSADGNYYIYQYGSGGGNRPPLDAPGTTSGTNSLTMYTNQAKEFQAPASSLGETTDRNSGAYQGDISVAILQSPYTAWAIYTVDYELYNHRSWHPAMGETGRTVAIRGGASPSDPAIFEYPWRNGIGTQTMYCSDCHGSNVPMPSTSQPSSGSVVPVGGQPWGPHGSSNNFILKGGWDASSGTLGQSFATYSVTGNALCLKCHTAKYYSGATSGRVEEGGARTGFWLGSVGAYGTDGHAYHALKINNYLSSTPGKFQCSWCHAAVPHGWKNKALLVNLNDVGPEAGLPPGTQVRNGAGDNCPQGTPSCSTLNCYAYSPTSGHAPNPACPWIPGYTRPPYYLNAMLKVRRFASSGYWTENDCGSAGRPGNNEYGSFWMIDGSENCRNPP